MPVFLNPFRKHDVSDFPNTYVPLQHAQRHHSVVETHGDNLAGMRDDGETGSNQSPPMNEKDGKQENEKHAAAHSDHETVDETTLESLRAEIDSDLAASGHDTAYDRKAKVINKAIMDIGMGRYQWQLFTLCGFGWLADNMWLQTVALTLPSLSSEFDVSTTHVRFTTFSLFLGLCIGASFWGVAADVIGRRFAFNMTLFLAGVFGFCVGAAPNWIGACGLYAALGVGIGGNLPVDGALFLEFVPTASQNLLTLLSVWWPVGQLIGSLVAWGFLTNYKCDASLPTCPKGVVADTCCHRSINMGWRYFNITIGAFTFFMFICRFFFFHLFESPKYLLARGRQAEAVATVHGIAYKNKRKTWLSEEVLNAVGGTPEVAEEGTKLSNVAIVTRFFSKFSGDRIAPLFSTRRLGIMTVLLWFCWTTIGMGYPLFNAFLPQYLENTGKDQAPTPNRIVYRNYAITSIVGVPGSIIAWWTVEIKYVGRKGTIAIATMITGILLFLFTVSSNSDYQLAFTCLEAFFQNIMYGVLYAYTPEVFPAPNRGTGTGIASCLNRIAGFCATIVGAEASTNPSAPVYASGGLILAAFVAMVLFPIETRGKQSL